MTTTTMKVTQTTMTSSTAQFGRASQQFSPSPEALFHQRLTRLGEIFKAHRSWNDKEVSFPLRKWIVDALKTYVKKNNPLSGEALRADIQHRLKVLSALLQDCLYQAPVSDARMDRKWIWNRRDLEAFQRLARVFGVGEFYQAEGGVFLSPIDQEPMQPQNHLFMNAMVDWVASLPMDLIDPSARSSFRETDEIKREAEPENEALTQAAPAPLGPLDFLQYLSILRVADCAYERVFQTNRAEETSNEKRLFQEAMVRLLAEGEQLAAQARADQIAFEQSIRLELTTYQEANEAEKTLLRGEMRDLRTENASNAQTMSSYLATINGLTAEVGSLRQLSSQRQVEIREVHHNVNHSKRFCSLI